MTRRGTKFGKSARLGLPLSLLAGVVATGAMTVAMSSMFRRLPTSDAYPLPPAEIVIRTVCPPGRIATSSQTIAAHFAFGAAVGALYDGVCPDDTLPTGVLFGLSVWGASY